LRKGFAKEMVFTHPNIKLFAVLCRLSKTLQSALGRFIIL